PAVHQGGGRGAAVHPYHPARQLPSLEEFDDERPRHVEERGGLGGRHLRGQRLAQWSRPGHLTPRRRPAGVSCFLLPEGPGRLTSPGYGLAVRLKVTHI